MYYDSKDGKTISVYHSKSIDPAIGFLSKKLQLVKTFGELDI